MTNAALVEIEASLGQVSRSINISCDKLQELSDFDFSWMLPHMARGPLIAHPWPKPNTKNGTKHVVGFSPR